MSSKDPNFVIKVEQAIAEKYGEEAIKNPRADWNEEKEKEYLEQLKKIYKKENKKKDKVEKIEVDGILVNRKLINRKSKRSCTVCKKYLLDSRDDAYMAKWDCCFKCYIFWVEDREERWKAGWRPKQEKQ